MSDHKDLNKIFNDFLDAFVEAAKAFFDQNLEGVILFGAHKEFYVHNQSDVDLLVICKDLPGSSWERYDMIMQLLQLVEPSREQLSKEAGLPMYISPVLKATDEMLQMEGRFNKAATEGKVIYEKGGIVKDILQKVSQNAEETD